MSLTSALTTARSSLQTTSAQIAISGRNIAGASDPSYSRKLAPTSATPDGVVRLVSVMRATDAALYFTMLGATSNASNQQALNEGLQRLAETTGDPESGQSPAAKLGALVVALQQYANRPDDSASAQGVVTKAAELTTTLNSAANAVTKVRETADADIQSSVSSINDLLARFETLNQSIVQGTFAGADVTDELDQRSAVLAKLSEEIGISVVSRANNDMVIYTDSGVTLFETTARTVAFQTTSPLASGASGNAVFIDGVPVTGENATMPIHSGKLVGLTKLRDDVAATYQTQLDEVARGLVEAFAEQDQSGGGGPALAGLFTYSGGPAIPATGTYAAGLAASIKVNAAVDPAQGGSLALIRDGGINGAGYVYNTGGGNSFATRLDGLVVELGAARAFDASSLLDANQSLKDFGAASNGWLEGLRQTSASDVEYQTALVARASDALSNATGVNLDDEYALQLQLEQSYAAASKLFGVINDLFKTLLDAS